MGIGTSRASRHLRLVAPLSESSDGELVAAARTGDRSAYAELWQRHSRAAITVARSYTSFDADDVVAEAFANIYTAITTGGGPTAGFRPYLFTTVRNVAAQWGRAANTLNVEDIETVGDISNEADTMERLEKTLTTTAFRSLPDSWQEVLWYSQVESMTPRQISPLLGLSPNSVSALMMRAREGLRVAWIKAHLSSATTSPDCTWTLGKLAAWSRNGVSVCIKNRIDDHLESCEHCRAAADEASNINSRLALILLPLAAGVAGAAAYVKSAGSAASTMPVALASGVGASASGAGVAVLSGLVAAAIAVAVCVTLPSNSGSAVAGTEHLEVSRPAPTTIAVARESAGQTTGEAAASAPLTSNGPSDADTQPDAPVVVPASGPDALTAETVAAVPSIAVSDRPAAVDAPSIASSERPIIVYPAVRGSAVPDAVVTVTVQGLAAEWTTVAGASGDWELELTDLTPGVWSVTSSQAVTDASGTRISPDSPSVTVELAEPPQSASDIAGPSVYDVPMTGLPNASFSYVTATGDGADAERRFTMDRTGRGWLAVSPQGRDASVFVFYVFGDFVGPMREIAVS